MEGLYEEHEDVIDAYVKKFLTTLAGGDDMEIDMAVAEMKGHIEELWNSEEFATHKETLIAFGIEDIMKEAEEWLHHFVVIAKKSDGIFEGKPVELPALAQKLCPKELLKKITEGVEEWMKENNKSVKDITLEDLKKGAEFLKSKGLTKNDGKAVYDWALKHHPEETAMVEKVVNELKAEEK